MTKLIRSIIQIPDPILLRKASKVRSQRPSYLNELMKDLTDSVKFYGGAGLAAPQIGVSLRMFVIRKEDNSLKVFINPELIFVSSLTDIEDEGCLSIPGLVIPVERSRHLRVKSDSGAENLAGFEARVFQHELDHLNGITLIEKPNIAKPVIV